MLPNTKANVSAYGPLNKSLFKALTDLWLKEENACYIDDNGIQRTHHRHVFIDEFGHAGQLDELDRLMGEGRTFGVNGAASVLTQKVGAVSKWRLAIVR